VRGKAAGSMAMAMAYELERLLVLEQRALHSGRHSIAVEWIIHHNRDLVLGSATIGLSLLQSHWIVLHQWRRRVAVGGMQQTRRMRVRSREEEAIERSRRRHSFAVPAASRIINNLSCIIIDLSYINNPYPGYHHQSRLSSSSISGVSASISRISSHIIINLSHIIIINLWGISINLSHIIIINLWGISINLSHIIIINLWGISINLSASSSTISRISSSISHIMPNYWITIALLQVCLVAWLASSPAGAFLPFTNPPWPPTYDLRRSTIAMAWNTTSWTDPSFARHFGIVSFDWSNAKQLWANTKPMDCEGRLLTQARATKAAGWPRKLHDRIAVRVSDSSAASNGTDEWQPKVFVYRNLVKALPWFESVRRKIEDPRYSGFFLKVRRRLARASTHQPSSRLIHVNLTMHIALARSTVRQVVSAARTAMHDTRYVLASQPACQPTCIGSLLTDARPSSQHHQVLELLSRSGADASSANARRPEPRRRL